MSMQERNQQCCKIGTGNASSLIISAAACISLEVWMFGFVGPLMSSDIPQDEMY